MRYYCSNIFYIFFLATSLSILGGCSSEAKLDNWSMALPVIGSNASPRAIDLTGDGIKDIIIGAGKNEFQESKHGVIAINGTNGDTLWTYPCIDQIYGTPLFLQISDDTTPDVIMVGRDKQLYAINGASGALIWEYTIQSQDYNSLGLARFNFYNPVVIDDFSDDAIPDLLIANGGNVNATPGDTINRHPGVLMVINSSDGSVIALDTMPDGKETYLTPTYIDFDQDGNKEILFGTGGETVTGTLFCTTIKDLLQNDISKARKLVHYDNGHGFIAPPLVTDLTNDGTPDILVLDHGGIVLALDGKDFSSLWETRFENVELNAQASVGNYNGDGTPDFFINGASGKWPKNTGSRQFFLNGKDGSILAQYEVGCAGFASAVSWNLDNDPLDEILLPINSYDCRRNNTIYTQTWLHLFEVDTSYQLMQTLFPGKNISSTPWLGDLDGDNKVDLVYVVNENVRLIYEFLGLRVKRIELNIPIPKEDGWTEYLGKNRNNIF